MTRVLFSLICVFAVASAGCGSGRNLGRGGIAPAPSKPPPGFPVSRDVPIDPQLVSAANRELDELLRSEWPVVRAHAIEGLRYTQGSKSAERIIPLIDNESQVVRFAAVMAAGDLKLTAAKPELEEHLADPDARVRAAVRYALHRLGDYTHSRDLEVFARDASPQVRGVTAMALGRIGEPSALNVLRPLRVDGNAAVRQQAEEALFLLGEERARKAIVGYTNSRFPDDVMLGLRALAEQKDSRFRAHARGHLTNDYPEIALVAARAMGAMNADDGYGVAMNGLKSNDARHRQLAALALGAIGRSDAQELLAPLLKDENAEVRAAAATAILQIARDPKVFSRQGDVVRE